MSNGHRSAAYRFSASVLRGPIAASAHYVRSGVHHLPQGGGFVVASNHLSYFDPLALALFLHDHGLSPRFMGKEELFHLPVAGRILRSAGQIPVRRGTVDAAGAYREAVHAVLDGECVVVFPEGTVTRDPDLWPMKAKTGAARIALETHAPLVPVAMWGTQDVVKPKTKRVSLWPRHTVRVAVGAPVDLSDLYRHAEDRAIQRAATDRLMDAIRALLEDVRGEAAPAERFERRMMTDSDVDDPHPPDESGGHPA